MGNGITSLRVAPEAMSETTRRVRDEEVRELADQAARAARAILSGHRAQLDELATTLLGNEVLERGDIESIMRGIPHAAPERRSSGHLGIAAATASDPARPGVAADQ
jgi:ATP-dependent Zn protease